MRFYLDCAKPKAILAAAEIPCIAGVVTSNPVLIRDGVRTAKEVFEIILETGRKDWKFWFELPRMKAPELAKEAEKWAERLKEATGSEFAGPTLVHRIHPTPEMLFGASMVLHDGREVNISGITNLLQGMAVTSLPRLQESHPTRITQGPPASRTPYAPDSVSCHIGGMDDDGLEGIQTVVSLAKLYNNNQVRTRILATGIRSPEKLNELLGAMSKETVALAVDIAIPENLIDLLRWGRLES